MDLTIKSLTIRKCAVYEIIDDLTDSAPRVVKAGKKERTYECSASVSAGGILRRYFYAANKNQARAAFMRWYGWLLETQQK